MEQLPEWCFRHPLLVLWVGISAFVLWLAAPITWRDGEGSIVESGENVRTWASLWGAWSGNIYLLIISKGSRL